MNLFDNLDKFFLSFGDYLSFDAVLWLFAVLFILTAIFVLIISSMTYESKLIKTIDKFNNYFASNPQITEDNLFQFNNMMKSSRVPKQLRKQWQQFVLYRDNVASAYMSFDICVSSPLKNSGYKRAIKIMNILSYIYVVIALLLNAYCMYENVTNLGWFFQHLLITPVLILVLNFLVTIFLEARYNAIVEDINSNYQYFTTNIDKATTTIPEYVDYEVLFDKNEIKRGIPILYAYLQRRAEEEKRELDRARLKNIEHEKFNFDEAGIESSLVLERAMQEAENYIAERKKYLQDVEQINAEITQEELNFREATKEYQRQMQVSKESFANFKEQLEQVSSSIEANYLKKQQQQELDRQRNLERDYDAANENHKRIMENFQAELTSLENDIKQSRVVLEKGMMSEFSTYSNKVYDSAKQLVDQREQEQKQKLKLQIKALEEKLAAKDQELNNIYEQNQHLNSKIINSGNNTNLAELEKSVYKQGKNQKPDGNNSGGMLIDESLNKPVVSEPKQEEVAFNYLDEDEQESKPEVDNNFNFNYLDEAEQTTVEQTNNEIKSAEESGFSFNYLDDVSDEQKEPEQDSNTNFNYLNEMPTSTMPTQNNAVYTQQPTTNNSNAFYNQTNSNNNVNYQQQDSQPQLEIRRVKSPGRPRKIITEPQEKRGRGRPKKTEEQKAMYQSAVKRSPGRPKKTENYDDKPVSQNRVGRPRKAETSVVDLGVKRGRGRPAKVAVEPNMNIDQVDELEAYLKEIDAQIAQENEKIEKTKQELEKNSSIKPTRN